MGDPLVALGAALLAACVLARIGARFGLPTIPLFMLAGVIFGPHTPGLDLFGNPEEIELLATIGLVMLLFYLGLEFSVDELVGGGRRLLRVGLVYLALNIGAGLAFGFSLGWGNEEALVIAGAIGISSSAIVTKLLVELRRLANPETRPILGIIVIEDLFIALYLAALQPVLHDASTVGDAVASIAKAFGFLLVLALVARKGSGLVGRLITVDNDELLTIGFVGLVLLVAGVAEELGVSDAIGAFMVGSILAQSVAKPRIEQLVLPLRDTFAALFFFSFGLAIDPDEVASVALPILGAVALTGVMCTIAGLLTARAYGFGRRAATNIGTALVARGEFSLIMASLAATAGLDPRITALVAGYVLILALGAPILASNARSLSRLVPVRACPGGAP
jgi:CPA2 family monovalent cation:H+ antiporter-2